MVANFFNKRHKQNKFNNTTLIYWTWRSNEYTHTHNTRNITTMMKPTSLSSSYPTGSNSTSGACNTTRGRNTFIDSLIDDVTSTWLLFKKANVNSKEEYLRRLIILNRIERFIKIILCFVGSILIWSCMILFKMTSSTITCHHAEFLISCGSGGPGPNDQYTQLLF